MCIKIIVPSTPYLSLPPVPSCPHSLPNSAPHREKGLGARVIVYALGTIAVSLALNRGLSMQEVKEEVLMSVLPDPEGEADGVLVLSRKPKVEVDLEMHRLFIEYYWRGTPRDLLPAGSTLSAQLKVLQENASVSIDYATFLPSSAIQGDRIQVSDGATWDGVLGVGGKSDFAGGASSAEAVLGFVSKFSAGVLYVGEPPKDNVPTEVGPLLVVYPGGSTVSRVGIYMYGHRAQKGQLQLSISIRGLKEVIEKLRQGPNKALIASSMVSLAGTTKAHQGALFFTGSESDVKWPNGNIPGGLTMRKQGTNPDAFQQAVLEGTFSLTADSKYSSG